MIPRGFRRHFPVFAARGWEGALIRSARFDLLLVSVILDVRKRAENVSEKERRYLCRKTMSGLTSA